MRPSFGILMAGALGGLLASACSGADTRGVPYAYMGGTGGTGGGPTGGTGGGPAGGTGAMPAGGTGGAPTGGTGGAPIGGTGGLPVGGTGAAPSGGSGGSSGSGGTGGAGTGEYAVGPGGYVTTGTWHGYAWTAASGGTITPDDFSAVSAGEQLCASGTVDPSPTSSGVAMLGINLNQALSEPNPAETVTPTSEGIIVEVSNPGGSALRVQIQGPAGATQPDDRWCAQITGNGGFIPWSSFNTMCWDNSGSYYAGEPLVSAMVLVPGSNSAVVTYDFCVTNLAESGGGTGGTGGSGGTGGTGGSANQVGTGSTCDQFGKLNVARDGVDYLVLNNAWGGWDGMQCMDIVGTSFTITQQAGDASGQASPVSYPSVIYGTKTPDDISRNSRLPMQVSALGSVMTGWSTNAGEVSGIYNAAYDVWFNRNAGDTGGPTGAYLMVWIYDPPEKQPIGDVTGSVDVAGATWDAWTGTGPSGAGIVSYVRQGNTPSITYDLGEFIDDAVGRGIVDNNMFLANVQAGFEIWSGGVGLHTHDFWISM